MVLAFALMAGDVLAQAAIPPDPSGHLETLSAKQKAFVESGEPLRYMPEAQWLHEWESRDSEALSQLIDDLVQVSEQMGYDPQRDMGAIPLNLESKNFHRGMVTTPAPLRKMKRDPGPFSVHRYLYPESGVPTFAGARVAIWPEDLVAGGVDVAIIGVPSDMGSGRRSASEAPDFMRALNTMAQPDPQSLVDPLQHLTVVDYGDFSVDGLSAERSIGHLRTMVAETAATGAVPVLVGGDTSILYAGLNGVTEAQEGPIGVLHWSAHPDSDGHGDHLLSDERALFRLIDEGVVSGSDVVVVGLRGAATNRANLEWMRAHSVRYHTATAFHQAGPDKALRRIISEVEDGPERLYVSVDVSVIEPAEMIAAGRVVPGGLAIADVVRTIRHVCADREIAGFEITDFSPRLDLSRLSAINANALVNACLVGMAVRAAGLEPDYVHPLVAGHGQR